MPAAGAAADPPDPEGLVGDKGQVRSSPGGGTPGKGIRAGEKPLPRTSHGTVYSNMVVKKNVLLKTREPWYHIESKNIISN